MQKRLITLPVFLSALMFAANLIAHTSFIHGDLEKAKTLAAVQAEAKTLAGQSSKAASDAAAAQKQLRELVDKANRIDQQLVNLKSDLLTRVKDNEEAIEAIDAYRRTINRDILQLKQKQNQAPAPASAQ